MGCESACEGGRGGQVVAANRALCFFLSVHHVAEVICIGRGRSVPRVNCWLTEGARPMHGVVWQPERAMLLQTWLTGDVVLVEPVNATISVNLASCSLLIIGTTFDEWAVCANAFNLSDISDRGWWMPHKETSETYFFDQVSVKLK